MPLTTIYDNLDDIPESVNFRELFTEKDGKFELTGIDGIKTPADIARLTSAHELEKKRHKETKDKLAAWGDWDRNDIQTRLDRMEELEAAAGDKLDDAKLDELANRRADGILKTKLAPMERQVRDLTRTNEELAKANGQLSAAANSRHREDTLRPLLVDAKVLPQHHEDVFLYAERHLERTEDGQWITRDGISNVTPGSTPKDWLAEMLERRPGWLPASEGGGATGSRGGGQFRGAKNPWSKEHWNITEQGQVIRESGREKAEQMAKAAGSFIGARDPKTT